MEALQYWSVIAGLLISFLTLLIVLRQTRHLGKQTNMLSKSLEYSSYLKLLDYLNEVNRLVVENTGAKKVFAELHFIKDSLAANRDLSIEKIGLAWLMLNCYEAAFVGSQLGALPEGEWEVWKCRLARDIRLQFVRDTWQGDAENFDYNRGFRELINELTRTEAGR